MTPADFMILWNLVVTSDFLCPFFFWFVFGSFFFWFLIQSCQEWPRCCEGRRGHQQASLGDDQRWAAARCCSAWGGGPGQTGSFETGPVWTTPILYKILICPKMDKKKWLDGLMAVLITLIRSVQCLCDSLGFASGWPCFGIHGSCSTGWQGWVI